MDKKRNRAILCLLSISSLIHAYPVKDASLSTIIFLNGCGSAGKTSIARAIQSLSDKLWVCFGIDTFIGMATTANPAKDTQYLTATPGKNERGATVHVACGPQAERFFGAMPEFAALLADRGNNIIIDEVLFTPEMLHAYAQQLKNHTVYYVGVFCDLKAMQEREMLRRDRHIGLANDQIDRVHAPEIAHYDIEVDTTYFSPFEIARTILDYIAKTPDPTQFKQLLKATYE